MVFNYLFHPLFYGRSCFAIETSIFKHVSTKFFCPIRFIVVLRQINASELSISFHEATQDHHIQTLIDILARPTKMLSGALLLLLDGRKRRTIAID